MFLNVSYKFIADKQVMKQYFSEKPMYFNTSDLCFTGFIKVAMEHAEKIDIIYTDILYKCTNQISVGIPVTQHGFVNINKAIVLDSFIGSVGDKLPINEMSITDVHFQFLNHNAAVSQAAMILNVDLDHNSIGTISNVRPNADKSAAISMLSKMFGVKDRLVFKTTEMFDSLENSIYLATNTVFMTAESMEQAYDIMAEPLRRVGANLEFKFMYDINARFKQCQGKIGEDNILFAVNANAAISLVPLILYVAAEYGYIGGGNMEFIPVNEMFASVGLQKSINKYDTYSKWEKCKYLVKYTLNKLKLVNKCGVLVVNMQNPKYLYGPNLDSMSNMQMNITNTKCLKILITPSTYDVDFIIDTLLSMSTSEYKTFFLTDEYFKPVNGSEAIKFVLNAFTDGRCDDNMMKKIRKALTPKGGFRKHKYNGIYVAQMVNIALKINSKMHIFDTVEELIESQAFVELKDMINEGDEFGYGKFNKDLIKANGGNATYLDNEDERKYNNKGIRKPVAYQEDSIDSLIGLDDIKTQFHRIINYYAFKKFRNTRENINTQESLSMIFTGNPGTAKTTVAKFLGKELYKHGVLSNDNFVIATRADLCGKYVGYTAQMTTEVFNKAKGGILFIDEAYSLSDHDSRVDYGYEAINQLVALMEENRDTMVIFAGYPKEMDNFVKSNPGLASRIGFHLKFNNYNEDELIKIFDKFVTDNQYIVDQNCYEPIHNLIKNNIQEDNFGNGRFMRNLFDKAIINQGNRLATKYNMDFSSISSKEMNTLLPEDFDEVNYYEGETKKTIGFGV